MRLLTGTVVSCLNGSLVVRLPFGDFKKFNTYHQFSFGDKVNLKYDGNTISIIDPEHSNVITDSPAQLDEIQDHHIEYFAEDLEDYWGGEPEI